MWWIFIEVAIVLIVIAAITYSIYREEKKRNCALTLAPEREKLQGLIVDLEAVVDDLRGTAQVFQSDEESKTGAGAHVSGRR